MAQDGVGVGSAGCSRRETRTQRDEDATTAVQVDGMQSKLSLEGGSGTAAFAMHRQDKSFDTFRANIGKDCGVNWVYLLRGPRSNGIFPNKNTS